MRAGLICLAVLLASSLRPAQAQDFIDRVDRALTISLSEDQIRARLSGLFDLDYYHFPQPPPGLIRADNGHYLFAPRLTLFVDAQAGAHVYFFAQARADTGFDPSDLGGQVRLDEYALRFTPWEDGRFNLQIGKFPTVIGNWIERHLSWENPFVNAPLPYEHPTLVSDLEVPINALNFIKVPGFDKYEFLPIIWGPAYTIGISAAGRIGIFEYAIAVKNAAVSSRPETWKDFGFTHPAVDLRVGLRPNEAWRIGFSASEGPYLRANARPLPAGADFSDYRQILLGQDISYARGHLQIWAEAFQSRFEIPQLGNADVFAYYVEVKYKFTPQLFGALRWGQELFDSERDARGNTVSRARDIWRVDAAVGYRFTAHTQLKLQYSLAHGDFISDKLGSTIAAQFTVRF